MKSRGKSQRDESKASEKGLNRSFIRAEYTQENHIPWKKLDVTPHTKT